MTKRIILFSCLALLVITTTAHAQQTIPLNAMVTAFQQGAAGWQATLTALATRTFGELALIELAWACTRLAVGRSDVSEWVSMLINEIMYLGLFFWLLSAPQWATWIINSFRQAAQTAGGVQTMQPGDILTIGINLAGQILAAISFWTPKSSLVLILSGIMILVCFAYIVLAMIVALVESWFIIGSMVLFMAFGGSQWTKDIAIGVIRHLFGLGTRIFALQLIAALGYRMGTQWVGMIGNMDAQEIMLILGCSIILMGVALEVPKSMERMVNGTSTSHAGGLIAAGAGAIGAAAGVGMVAGRAAAGLAGVGAAAGQATMLTSEQLAASGSTATGMARAGQMISGTARNMASAAASDVGRRLSGQSTGAGMSSWRQAASLSNQRRLLAEDLNKPPPPPPPSNSINGNNP